MDPIIENIIIRQPTKPAIAPDTNIYLGEVWYRMPDGRVVKPIFQTPRLRIMYGVKKFQDGTHNYCVSLRGRDIDHGIEKFFNMIQAIDKHFIHQIKEKTSQWNLANIKKVYSSPLMRKSNDHEFYLKLKLIQDRDGSILTTITNVNRSIANSNDIIYGRFTDQYISPTFICFHDEGIQPIWQAHQVVISEHERLFLSKCLLDSILPQPPPPPPPVNLPIRQFIQQNELPNMKSKIQHTKTSSMLINAADLLKGRENLRKLKKLMKVLPN